MIIEVKPSKRVEGMHYEADSPDLCGMPRVGLGATPEEAVADFMREQMSVKSTRNYIIGQKITVTVEHPPETVLHTVVLEIKAVPGVTREKVLECCTNVFNHHTPDLLYDVKVTKT